MKIFAARNYVMKHPPDERCEKAKSRSTVKHSFQRLETTVIAVLLVFACSLVTAAPSYHSEHSIKSSDLETHSNQWSSSGYHLVYLSGFEDEKQVQHYNAIWHENRKDIEWKYSYGVPETELEAILAAEADSGFVPVFVDGFSITDPASGTLVPRFNVIFHKHVSLPLHFAEYGMDSEEFQNHTNEYNSMGYSLDVLSTYQVDGDVRLACVFSEPTSDNDKEWRYDMDIYQSNAHYLDLVEVKGYSLEYMSAGAVDDRAPRYAGIFVKPTGQRSFFANIDLDFESMELKFREWTIRGYVPKVIDAYKTRDGTVRWALLFTMFEPEANGDTFPETDCFDNMVTEFMRNNDIPGVGAAVMKDGKVVYSQGFGVRDVPGVGDFSAVTRSVMPDTPFRIGSVSKSLTILAVLKLVQQGKLRLSDSVFGEGGILQHMSDNPNPCCPIVDDRIYDITINHLLTHQAGWNKCVASDHTQTPFTVASTLDIEGPAGVDDFIMFYLGQPLQYDPGTICFDYNTGCSYANLGYIIVGRIIEQVTGKGYVQAVRDLVLNEAGIPEDEFYMGSTQLKDIPEYETEYYCADCLLTVSVFPSEESLVPFPYGAWHQEAAGAAGGWVASAEQLVRMLTVTSPPHCNGTIPNQNTNTCMLWQSSVDSLTAKPENCDAGDTIWYGLGYFIDSNYAFAEDGRPAWLSTGGMPAGNAAFLVRTNQYTWAVLANVAVDADFEPIGWEAVRCVEDAGGWPSGFLQGQVQEIEDETNGALRRQFHIVVPLGFFLLVFETCF